MNLSRLISQQLNAKEEDERNEGHQLVFVHGGSLDPQPGVHPDALPRPPLATP